MMLNFNMHSAQYIIYPQELLQTLLEFYIINFSASLFVRVFRALTVICFNGSSKQ